MNRRNFLLSSGGLAVMRASRSFAFAQVGPSAAPAAASRNICSLLFFDDWPLDRRDHVERHIGHPEWHQEVTFVDPHLNVTWGYPSVFRDSDTGVWRCLYQGWGARKKRLYPLVAESTDGVRWHTPDLSRTISLPGREFAMKGVRRPRWKCHPSRE